MTSPTRAGCDGRSFVPRACSSLPDDAEAGTRVFVVEDDQTITHTITRSKPWALGSGHLVVQLKGKSGCYLARRCFLDREAP